MLKPSAPKPWRRLPAAQGALAGIEFALVLPVLLAMLAGVVDLSLAVITERRRGHHAMERGQPGRGCRAAAVRSAGGGAGRRPSGTATLPAGVFGVTSVLVGDVSTVFVPLFTSVFTGPVAMLRSAYVPPRVNNSVQLTSPGLGQSVTCPSQPKPTGGGD